MRGGAVDRRTSDEKDADRYRWLRDRATAAQAARIVNDIPSGMDKSIDAAIMHERATTKLGVIGK